MKLHFLGTTGYHANDSRQTACLMLPEIGVIFDAGTGLYRAKDIIETSELHIFLSHTHLDHVVGLTFLFDVLAEKEAKVFVHIDETKREAITKHLFHPDLFPIQPEFEIVPFGNDAIELPDGAKMTTIPLEHPGGSIGFRIDWPDRSMAYITDTVAHVDAPYVNSIEGVDTLIHECYFPDGWEDRGELTGHSCLTPVAEVAKKSNAGEVYLVHINPLDEAGDQIDVSKVVDIHCEDPNRFRFTSHRRVNRCNHFDSLIPPRYDCALRRFQE